MERYCKLELRVIDAVRDEGFWAWNDSFVIAQDIYWLEQDLTPRRILRQLRKWGYLAGTSKGQVRVIDDGDVIEVQEASTGRPVLALLRLETKPA